VHAVWERSHSETAVLEMIGYRYMLADCIGMANFVNRLWPDW